MSPTRQSTLQELKAEKLYKSFLDLETFKLETEPELIGYMYKGVAIKN